MCRRHVAGVAEGSGLLRPAVRVSPATHFFADLLLDLNKDRLCHNLMKSKTPNACDPGSLRSTRRELIGCTALAARFTNQQRKQLVSRV